MADRPRVLFVSKAVVPPIRDGSLCLVRDVALGATRVEPWLMSAPGVTGLGSGADESALRLAPVYSKKGGFAPGLRANLQAALWLGARARADIWHYVFAPNPRTSTMARWLRRVRRAAVVQTVASAPRSYEGVAGLLFGDVIVAQSEWTAARIRAAVGEGWSRPLHVIPPSVAPLGTVEPGRVARARAAVGLPADAPYLLYPGDLEVSGGARLCVEAIGGASGALAGHHLVLACRQKTPSSVRLAAELMRENRGHPLHLAGEVEDMPALLFGATAVWFPVDDLWGKVDLPIVLLEAMNLGVPVIALDQGPLRELGGVLHCQPEPRHLMEATVALLGEPGLRDRIVDEQRRAIQLRHERTLVARRYEDLYLGLLEAETMSKGRGRDG